MIKRTSLVALSLIFSVLSLSAQNSMSVSSFRLLETDMAANTSGTMERDQNGETAALIKVQTTQTGFEFEAGSLGVVKTVQQTGEIWVYVPRRSLKLTIKHPQLGVLRDYYYPCPIKAGRTYELCLVSGEVVTTVKKDKGGDMLAVTVQPNSANLYIDYRSVPLENGQFTGFYSYGEHSYRVERSGYNSEAGHFTITSEGTTRLDISLEAAFATIRVECQTEGSEIYINQQKKGTTSYSEEVLDGTYLIEVRKQGYLTYQETVTLAEKEQCTVSVPTLTPIYGSLMANYKPVNADIYIDGVKRGSTPEIIEDILVGEHEVRISMKGYSDRTEQVIIVENQQCELSGELAIDSSPVAVPLSTTTPIDKSPKEQINLAQERELKPIRSSKEFSCHFFDTYIGYDVSGHNDFFFGLNYSWIGNRIGPYLSAGLGAGGAFSAFGGASWRITNPDYASLDWQLNGGIGYLDRNFGGEISTRFAWRTTARLSKWDFGVGCQFSGDRIVPSVGIGFYLWLIPISLAVVVAVAVI